MKSIGDPDYVPQPWSPERRAAASERAKKRYLAKVKARGLKGLIKTITEQAFGAGFEEGLRYANAQLSAAVERQEAKSKTRRPAKRTKKKMRGLFSSLTTDQQQAALSYRGPENHGLAATDIAEQRRA